MPQYIDSYYLIDNRKPGVVYDFFTRYFPLGLKELATEYPFPQFYDKSEKIYNSAEELFLHLENSPNSEYTVYFENKDQRSIIKQFTLQYTDDGKMIFGASIIGRDPSSEESIEVYKEIKNYLNAQKSCVTIEEAPPINASEFINFCNERYIPNTD